MFTGINLRSIPAAKAREETATENLIACHQRIRHFTAIARRIAESNDAPPEQVADAAADLHRYFYVALPLHEADENVSIDPRIEAAVPGTEAAQASKEMVRQHLDIRAVLNSLLPLWDALCREPEKLSSFSPRLLVLSNRLEKLWDAHLKLEEEIVFPAMEKYLSAQEKEEILREMRERRR